MPRTFFADLFSVFGVLKIGTQQFAVLHIGGAVDFDAHDLAAFAVLGNDRLLRVEHEAALCRDVLTRVVAIDFAGGPIDDAGNVIHRLPRWIGNQKFRHPLHAPTAR